MRLTKEFLYNLVKETLEDIVLEKDDRCTRIAKSKYDVWPSAYASGAVVRCRKGDIWKDLKEDEDDLQSKIRKALRDEGGAAGMDALKKHTEASAEEIRKIITTMDDVGQHEDGDYILDDKKHVDIVDEGEEGESLHKWFSRKGEKGSGSGWVDCNTCRKDKKTGKKTCKACGRKKGEKRSKYPACRPTPAACGKKGKGKKWGKKSKQKESLGMKNTDLRLEEIIEEEIEGMYLEFLSENEVIEEAEYQGRKVTLNKPTQGDVKKFKVYVKNEKGNVVKVNFGDPNMRIRKSNPAARKSFRARHKCDNPGPKWKARYWSCKKW